MEENNNNFQNMGGGNKQPKKKIGFYWIYIILIAFFLGSLFFKGVNPAKELTMTELMTLLRDQDVEKIELVNKSVAEIYLNEQGLKKHFPDERRSNFGETPNYTMKVSEDRLYQKVDEAQEGLSDPVEIIPIERHNWGAEVLSWVLPLVIILLFWIFIMRRMNGGAGGGQIFSIGQSKAKLYDQDKDQKTTFKDVAGLEEAKEEVMEIVDFLKNPKRYTRLGGKIPKGVLLVGPPGTGKTLLAKSVAGEAGVPFFSISGSDFVEMFVGVGASRVRDLFRQAKEKSPCIVFIDEIDAIGRARGKSVHSGGNDERENTLNQLLTEMDGFGSNSGVIILAATNRADILDKALMRPGRFDRQIMVDLPDVVGRREIFNVHLRNVKIDDTVDIEFLARQTPGFSGADIANVCNEAALIAARKEKKNVQKQDFLDAVDRIVGGLEKKNAIMTKSEKALTAYHEAGHATVSWLLQYANPLIKVTIVPRGRALGAAWYLPEERQHITTEHLLDEICSTLGGRAAESIIYGEISTGALNDLENTTKKAYALVAYYGMSDKLSNISYYDSTGASDYSFSKPYSEETAKVIDNEVQAIINEQYIRATQILNEHKDGLVELANLLIEREVIFTEDVERIFGKRPWMSRTDELNAEAKEKEEAEGKAEPTVTSEECQKDSSEEVAEKATEPTETPKEETPISEMKEDKEE